MAVVLMPADVAGGHRAAGGADTRLRHRLIVPQAYLVHAHEARADSAEQRAGGDRAEVVVEPEGVALLPHRRRVGLLPGPAILRRNRVVEVAGPEALVGAPQPGSGLRVEQPRAAPVAALAVLRQHRFVDQRIHVDSCDHHAPHLLSNLTTAVTVSQTRPQPRAVTVCCSRRAK